jgi:two-component system NtrC family response regulator
VSGPRHLLIVEDDRGLQRQLRWQLEAFELLQAGDRAEALSLLRARAPAVVLLDLGLPPDPAGVSEGFLALEQILAERPTTRVVVMTGREGREHALRAIAAGALDFHAKPVDVEMLHLVLERAFFVSALEAEARAAEAAGHRPALPGVIGASPTLLAACRMIERVAPAEASVLITGESGTGKEVMARALHQLSRRRGGRFVAINCAAIPPSLLEAELFGFERGAFTGALKQTPGRLELAHGGTLFLDEIGDLPVELQAKLLRFVQERVIERLGGREEIRLDLRIVCATHRDLRRAMLEGRFREDLYYRLAEIEITLPPLRDRPGDAVLIARHLLETYAREQGRQVAGSAPMRCGRSSGILGPATSASCRTGSSARCCSPRVGGSALPTSTSPRAKTRTHPSSCAGCASEPSGRRSCARWPAPAATSRRPRRCSASAGRPCTISCGSIVCATSWLCLEPVEHGFGRGRHAPELAEDEVENALEPIQEGTASGRVGRVRRVARRERRAVQRQAQKAVATG